jgi:transposase
MTALIVSFSELGLRNCVLVLDNGFFSDSNIQMILGADDMKFILPLKDNTTLVKAGHKPFISYKDVMENNFSYHNRFVFYRELDCGKYPDCRIFVYYDERRNKDLEKERLKKAQKAHGGKIPTALVSHLHKECEMLGVTMLLTNKTSDAESIYLDYKTRWAIEGMFDTMKNTLSFNMDHEVRYERKWVGLSLSSSVSICITR